MNILIFDSHYPMPDRASADVRMFAIVRLLREQGHECHYFASDITLAELRIGADKVAYYRDALRNLGAVTIDRTGFEQVIADGIYDLVFFKYFYPAETRISLVRIWQPNARVVVDSVDLVYARLRARAKVSGLPTDQIEAESTKNRELATYAAADAVITVTEDEAHLLAAEIPNRSIHVIPNIHEIPLLERTETLFPSLIFIGTFTHEPNIDGVLWFTREVFPRVLSAHPDTRLRIIGGNPPPEIQALNGDHIEIMGYVPDTLPFLMESWVSVAPLRFGAGMKGKVGEAMAAGLPVVTTSFGAEGFGLVPGVHLIVSDDPISFANSISTLIANRQLRSQLGSAGRSFIESRFSPLAVRHQLTSFVQRMADIDPGRVKLASFRRQIKRLILWFNRNLLWRLRQRAPI